MYSENVIVDAGANKGGVKRFIIPEPVIQSHDSLLKAAINKSTVKREDDGKYLKLPGISSDVFEFYVEWLFSGRFFILLPDRIELGKPGCEKTEAAELERWVSCFRLATVLKDVEYQDASIDALIEWIEELGSDGYSLRLSLRIAEVIYTSTTPDAPCRLLPVEAAVKKWSSEMYRQLQDHPETKQRGTALGQFYGDLIAQLAKWKDFTIKERRNKTQADFPFVIDLGATCQYHQHVKQREPCYKKRRPF